MENGQGPNSILTCVGWKEYVALPELGIRRVKAKIDTGARTSALDVSRYEISERGELLFARIQLARDPRQPQQLTWVEVPVLEMIVVTSSSGLRERRPLIETTVSLGTTEARIRLTLTNRAGMRFRMILGRHFLTGRFVVDVNRKYLLGKAPQRRRQS